MILHNFLETNNDNWDELDENDNDDYNDNNYNEENNDLNENALRRAGELKRIQIMNQSL